MTKHHFAKSSGEGVAGEKRGHEVRSEKSVRLSTASDSCDNVVTPLRMCKLCKDSLVNIFQELFEDA